jgi:hypothetical protein
LNRVRAGPIANTLARAFAPNVELAEAIHGMVEASAVFVSRAPSSVQGGCFPARTD